MSWFAGRAARDREHLVRALRSLRSTSVAGLAAALSWSERRTDRVIRDAAEHGYAPFRYDPSRRVVAWVVPTSPPPTPAPAAVPTAPPPTATAPVLPKSWGAAARCPSCQVAYEPTGTGDHLYCPQCGRLATGPGGSATPAPAARPSVDAAPSAASSLGPDRRSQELFAAWVTAQPIPCPKCRTPLRHHGVAEYACPACGARVTFDRSPGLPNRTGPTAAPPTAAPAPPVAPAAR